MLNPKMIVKFSISIVLGIGTLLGTSISMHTPYPDFCKQVIEHPDLFRDFKRHPNYQLMLEHTTYEQGLEYLNFIISEYPDLESYFNKFRENDLLGNPVTYEYGKYGKFSPTTLRYIKVAGDLKNKFGDLSKMHIVEIGAGYGGQCKILSDLQGFASYTIIDLPECNALTKKYLDLHGIKNVFLISNDKLSQAKNYDLVISNYAFSEIDEIEQKKYIDLIIGPTSHGYMTMNFTSHLYNIQSMSIEGLISELIKKDKKGKVEKEKPLTCGENLIISWLPTEIEMSTPLKSDIPQKYESEHADLTLKIKKDSPFQSASTPDYNSPKKNKTRLEPSANFQEGNAITYSFSGGRLGDNLISYLHAKWISYQYKLPLLYQPFQFSDQFNLHDLEQPMGDLFTFRNVVTIKNENEIYTRPNSTLFIIPFFPESKYEFETLDLQHLPYFKVIWDNPDFQNELIQCLTPKQPVNTINLPKNCITVGVHVRRGGGWDGPGMHKALPLKFPPDTYYIQQIDRIARTFYKQPLYIYVMTDDLNPQSIVDEYKKYLNYPNVTYACRTADNNHYSNILEDFFSITKFDCLILPQSNFSVVASKLSDYLFIATPNHANITHEKPVIDDITIMFNSKALKNNAHR